MKKSKSLSRAICSRGQFAKKLEASEHWFGLGRIATTTNRNCSDKEGYLAPSQMTTIEARLKQPQYDVIEWLKSRTRELEARRMIDDVAISPSRCDAVNQFSRFQKARARLKNAIDCANMKSPAKDIGRMQTRTEFYRTNAIQANVAMKHKLTAIRKERERHAWDAISIKKSLNDDTSPALKKVAKDFAELTALALGELDNVLTHTDKRLEALEPGNASRELGVSSPAVSFRND